MPKIYVDDESGFLAGRDRWQDADDFIVSLQLNSVTNGYMRVKRDGSLRLLRSPFADLRGATKGMRINEANDQASLLFNRKHQSLLIDLSGRSGERVVIASTLVRPIPKRAGKIHEALAAKSTGYPSQIPLSTWHFLAVKFSRKSSLIENGLRIGNLKTMVAGNELIFAPKKLSCVIIDLLEQKMAHSVGAFHLSMRVLLLCSLLACMSAWADETSEVIRIQIDDLLPNEPGPGEIVLYRRDGHIHHGYFLPENDNLVHRIDPTPAPAVRWITTADGQAFTPPKKMMGTYAYKNKDFRSWSKRYSDGEIDLEIIDQTPAVN